MEPSNLSKRLVSYVLLTGVLVSMSIIALGGFLFLSSKGSQPFDYHTFKKELWNFNDLNLMQLGVLLIIATPFIRVLVCLGMFLYQRDWLYTCISAIVLSVLIYSLMRSA